MSKLNHSNYPCSSKSQGTANSQELELTEQTDGDGPYFDQDFLDMSDLVCDEENYLI